VKDGYAYARQHRVIAAMLLIQAATSVLVNPNGLLPIYARDILNIGPQGYGFLVSAVGAGSISGMILVIWLGHAGSRARWMLVGSLLYPLMLMGFAVSTILPLSIFMLFACGLSDMTVSTMRQTLLQLRVEDSFRGRVMSLQSISARGLSPMGSLQSGTVASLVNAPAALVLSGALALVLILAVWRRTPEIGAREISTQPAVSPA
jgi:MFS family permease